MQIQRVDKMVKIRLMPDYFCYPIWGNSVGNIGNINPEELFLSSGLVNDLNKWASIYDETLNKNDPISSGFNSEYEKQLFISHGEELCNRMKEELGSEYIVEYNFVGGLTE